MTGNSQEMDRRIIRELQRDARQSNVELARTVGLTEGAVRRRIANLVASGALRFAALGDPQFMGLTTHAFFRMSSAPDRVEQLMDELAAMPELSYVYLCTGQFNLTAVGFFESIEHLHDFTTRSLGPLQGLLEVRTILILRTAKRSYRWGMDEAQMAVIDT